MRKISFSLILLLAFPIVAQQTAFDQFKQQQNSKFDKFKTGQQAEFEICL